jgi:multidrug efflux pump
MILSDLSVTRPVFASVISILLIVFGIVSFQRLSLREFPDIDPPVVSIDTRYRGASANVVETRITQVIEDRISGVEGIRFISSNSEDGRSRIDIEFDLNRDIDGAANDIRDRVSATLNNLPLEADPPEISKADTSEDVIMWLNLQSPYMTVPELTDYAERYLVDRFSILNGVARVRVGGGQRYAMRIWLDRIELAARGLVVSDVEEGLRAENVELPAGSIESLHMQFTVRVRRSFRTAQDFGNLVLGRGSDGHLVRLGDVARVEKGTEEDRTFFRGNAVPMVGIGITKQSTANTIDVARAAKGEAERLNLTLPEGMEIRQSFDSSIFVENAVKEVYFTLFIAITLVMLVIFIFLGNLRAVYVPAVTVPVSITATFILLYIFGFSINLLTLLALVLSIGLVVDDAIVVLENVYRRMDELGETKLVAAFRGAREVAFAVIATTLVLVSVFVPLAFLGGDIGRLFSEFALTMAAAVSFSSFVALSLSPMIASKVLRVKTDRTSFTVKTSDFLLKVRGIYESLLAKALSKPKMTAIVYFASIPLALTTFYLLPSEYTPAEDRGAFFVRITGPEGASHEYMKEYMNEIESRMMSLVEAGEITRLLVRSPSSFGNAENFNTGAIIVVLNTWDKRRSAWEIMADVRSKLSDLTGVQAFPVMRQGFRGRGGAQKPVQFVIGGGTYEELAEWRDILLEKINEDNPGLTAIDWDYKETKPQLEIVIDYDRAAELGVRVEGIGRTLETMLGSRRVTTYVEAGEEYDVILEGERDRQRTPTSLENIYVRSDRSDVLIPLSNLVTINEFAGSTRLNRFNRIRSITLEANLEDSYTLGAALSYLEDLVRDHLPETAVIDYKGQSRDFKFAGTAIGFIFLLGILTVFLVLAAQFESYIHPLVIILTVPLAILGGLLGLVITGGTLNLYSQVALIMLVGLAAKNGILIVEFANQLRDRGIEFKEALLQACSVRFRPIIMTAITTAAGTVPLILTSGAGEETRRVIGIVVLFGILIGTFFTLWIIPVAYQLFAKNTGSPGDVKRQLEAEAM